MSLEENLKGCSKDEYGDNYRPHLLEIYKLYVEMADRISARRQSVNSFFLAINTAIVALIGYVQLGNTAQAGSSFYWLVALAGIVLCFLWYRILRSYRDLNSGKFKVIHEIEKYLPLHPYDAEWTAVGRGEDPKLYLPFTHVEIIVPWVFFAIHLFVFVLSIQWSILSY